MDASSEDLRERLADVSHAIWSHWMRYQFSCCVENEDGSVTIPADKVARWRRQMDTPYSDLPDSERKSDRNQADKILAVHPPAWGPPQAQPDAEGWWAFDGETPWRHSEQGEAYRARKMCFVWEYSGNPGQWWVDRWGIDAKKFVGRWWRLTMPWEVTP